MVDSITPESGIENQPIEDETVSEFGHFKEYRQR